MKMETGSGYKLSDFRLFVLDLDNTVIKEEDYLFQAYGQIARHIASRCPGLAADAIRERLISMYREQGREKLFDRLAAELGPGTDFITTALDILRTFTPDRKLEMIEKTAALLRQLKDHGKTVFILTNGNPVQQRNKINHTEWGDLAGYAGIVYANEFSPKPSPAALLHILSLSGFSAREALMIGDSEVDSQCAAAAGTAFLNVAELKRLRLPE